MELVGRVAQVEKLSSVLGRKKQAQQRLTILPIFGPGGVGKSSLLQMAESGVDYRELRSMRIHVDGGNEITSLAGFVEMLVSAVKADASQRYDRSDVTLPETEATLATLRAILAEAEKEVGGSTAESIKNLIHALLRLGKAVNKVSKKSKEFVDFKEAEEAVEDLKPEETIQALQTEVPNLANKLGIGAKGKNLRNALRENAAKTFAGALVKDLTVLLAGCGLKDSAKPLPNRITGCDSLTLILDDYEHLVENAGIFLVKHFLPVLRESGVSAVVVISGRDHVKDTDPSWEQHLQSNLLDGIDVGPLTQDEIAQIAALERVDHKRLWADTEGYPYFIQLWIDAAKTGETATSLKRFYVRTTRWMNEPQKKWLRNCVVLDEVNRDTPRAMTGSEEEATLILRWFESESSVRATDTSTWTVRKYIRTRLCKYMELEDPSGFTALRRRAAAAAAVVA